MTAQSRVIPVGPQSPGRVHVAITGVQKSAAPIPDAAGRR